MAIRYEERNGRRYAYRCTSVRVPGKRNPVSRKEYLGVVDPDTGQIVPKKVSADSGRFFLTEGAARVLDYGDAVIAMCVCESLDVRRHPLVQISYPVTSGLRRTRSSSNS